ncbi:MAG: hypothetical protein KDA73_07560 [Rhodobacteraceae bacterium]|nr:hypothetical protein [Paracoccaceae bacterium]
MLDRLIGVAAALVALAPLAAPAMSEGAAREKVSAFLADYLGVSEADSSKDVAITLADLNGDGTDEALVVYSSPLYCGAGGCSAFVLELSAQKACSRADLLAFELAPGTTEHDGWRDVVADGITLRYAGGKYGGGSSTCK